MLATAGPLPRDDAAWAFELKWDGVRALAFLDADGVRLTSRNGNDLSDAFPELVAPGGPMAAPRMVADGEIVAFDQHGRPSFQLLQHRVHASGRSRSTAGPGVPLAYVLFDLLVVDGTSLLSRPYAERRQHLEALDLETAGAVGWTLSPRFAGPGSAVLESSVAQGLEGVVAKRLDSPYLPGRRTSSWIKVKNVRTQEVVVGGWTPGEGQRSGRIGSMLLGVPSGAGLVYVGQVGTGFSEAVLADLARRLEPLRSAQDPFVNEVPARYRKAAIWAVPRLVGEVRFSEWTNDGRLRQPSWRGLRVDKKPDEVRREP